MAVTGSSCALPSPLSLAALDLFSSAPDSAHSNIENGQFVAARQMMMPKIESVTWPCATFSWPLGDTM